jgi:hypothetical protein
MVTVVQISIVYISVDEVMRSWKVNKAFGDDDDGEIFLYKKRHLCLWFGKKYLYTSCDHDVLEVLFPLLFFFVVVGIALKIYYFPRHLERPNWLYPCRRNPYKDILISKEVTKRLQETRDAKIDWKFYFLRDEEDDEEEDEDFL